jgi:hypothetical protein
MYLTGHFRSLQHLIYSNHVCEKFVVYLSVITITLGILGTLGHFPAASGINRHFFCHDY